MKALKLLRNAWIRIVRVVTMPDEVMGRAPIRPRENSRRAAREAVGYVTSNAEPGLGGK